MLLKRGTGSGERAQGTGKRKMGTKPNLNPCPISKFISNSLFFILPFPVLVTSGLVVKFAHMT